MPGKLKIDQPPLSFTPAWWENVPGVLISHTEHQHPQLQVGPDDLLMSLPIRAIIRFYTTYEKVNNKKGNKQTNKQTQQRNSRAETNGREKEIGDEESYTEQASTGISS